MFPLLCTLSLQELERQLEGSMDTEGAADVEQRLPLYDRCINAYNEARAAIKATLQLGAGEGAWAWGLVVGARDLVLRVWSLGFGAQDVGEAQWQGGKQTCARCRPTPLSGLPPPLFCLSMPPSFLPLHCRRRRGQ